MNSKSAILENVKYLTLQSAAKDSEDTSHSAGQGNHFMCLMKRMRTTQRQTASANSAAQGSFLSPSNNYTA